MDAVPLMARRFVLVDRDGTINAEHPGAYVLSPREMELLPGAAEGLRALRAADLGIVVVSNQAPVARGWIDDDTLEAINGRMKDLLAAEGVALDGIYCCPHDGDDGCDCRKPEPGLLLRAARELTFDLGESFVIGDKGSDIEAGRRVGARTILVLTGQGAQAREDGTTADAVVADLPGAAAIIAGLVTQENP